MAVGMKDKDQKITEELLKNLVGNYVHVPTNVHKCINDLTGEEEDTNVWFAGKVAGYEISVLKYNYIENEFTDDFTVTYTLLMCDGMAYMLAEDCEIDIISEKDFLDMVEVYNAKKEIQLPGRDF